MRRLQRGMGVSPMFAVLRDIRSVFRSNPAIAERSSRTVTVAALELDWPEYRPMQRSTVATGETPVIRAESRAAIALQPRCSDATSPRPRSMTTLIVGSALADAFRGISSIGPGLSSKIPPGRKRRFSPRRHEDTKRHEELKNRLVSRASRFLSWNSRTVTDEKSSYPFHP
jgi:hypothetical protein